VERKDNVLVAWIGLGLVVVGSIAALWAVGNLADGLAELPHHWWSTLATVPMAIGVAITTLALARLSR
jgi:hypothetical protein